MGQKIEVVRGTSNGYTLFIADDSGVGYTLEEGERLLLGVKEEPKDTDLLILKVITECTDGICTVGFAPADTIGLKYGRYVYDVGLESGEDYYNVIEASPFVVHPNVTKWGDGT